MIAKRLPMKNVNASSFTRLAQYISSAQGKHERVGEIRLTNCGADTIELAAMEIEGVQALNKRTTMDKTYHLLVSFREGDRPAPEVLRIIEDRLIAAIGYSEHQRISAIHYDTDHMHLHIAINKIHPQNFKAIEPYYDKRKLGETAEQLEIEFNLARDNHIPRITQGAARAQDMEKAAGLESLIGWVKRGCLPELLEAKSWEALHQVLADNGLQILPRGNGLVITNGTIGAKASSIHRQLSKKSLEEKLGVFQVAKVKSKSQGKSQGQGTGGYKIQPMASKIDTSSLWQQYQQERQKQEPQKKGQEKSSQLEQAKARKDRLIKAAKAGARIKRAAIKLLEGKISKKILYHQVSQGLLKEIKKINEAYIAECKTFAANNKTNRMIWHDWLKAQAKAGNTEALEVLRHRYESQSKHGNVVTSIVPGNDNRDTIKTVKIDTVTKRGTIHYQVADGIVRDDGKSLRMADNLSDKALKAVLELAVKRFGRELAVQGTEKFKSAMVNIAANSIIQVSFANPELERQRQALVDETITARHRENTPVRAAEKYIAERNEKHQQGLKDVLPHRMFNEKTDAGRYVYAGTREVKDSRLILLQSPTEMLVLPVAKTAIAVARARQTRVGNEITVTNEKVLHPTPSRARELKLTIER